MHFNFIYKLPRIKRRIKRSFYTRYNYLIFKLLNVKFGRNLKVFNKIHLDISPSATIKIGNDFTFTSGDFYNPLCRNICGCIHAIEKKSTIIIGNNVGISSACLRAKEKIVIGNNVKIGGDCILLDTDAHNLNYQIRRSHEKNSEGKTIESATAKSAPIIIEDDVLIGTRCIILKGVTIGARSIIGSGSIVTKSIPSDCIAAGNPCKVIRFLNISHNLDKE